MGAQPKYDTTAIAAQLVQTALGHAWHGNALRVAKDMPGLDAEDRAVLDRYATGSQRGTDHAALQDIARRIYRAPLQGFTKEQLTLGYSEWAELVRTSGVIGPVQHWLAQWTYLDLTLSPMDDDERRFMRYGHYCGWFDRS